MDAPVMDLKKQMPDILRALKRKERVIVSYGRKKYAVMQPLQEDDIDKEVDDLCNDPAFGMWADHKDMENPSAWVRKLRKGRDHVV